ncbi:hypothetical protein AGMMS4956_00220 [Bacteroidia bacterium]|nr:hypothetical protein AGMMS4956_00220 [Bacteroidia bacterium]
MKKVLLLCFVGWIGCGYLLAQKKEVSVPVKMDTVPILPLENQAKQIEIEIKAQNEKQLTQKEGWQEFSLYAFGGIPWLSFNNSGVDWKASTSAQMGFGLGYTLFFTPQSAFLLGLEISSFNTVFKSSGIISSVAENSNIKLPPPVGTRTLESTNTFEQYEETVRINYFSIPLMYQHNIPISKDFGFYAGLGLKPTFSFSNKATLKAKGNSLIDSMEIKGIYDNEPVPVAEDDRIKFTNPISSRKRATKGLPVKVNLFLDVDAGIRWKINDNYALYAGFYFDYSLLSLNRNSGEGNLFTYYEAPNAPYYKDDFTGVLSSHYIKNVHQWNAGIKLRLGINKNHAAATVANMNAPVSRAPKTPASVRILVQNYDSHEPIPATIAISTAGKEVQQIPNESGDFAFRMPDKTPYIATLSLQFAPDVDVSLIKVDSPNFTPQVATKDSKNKDKSVQIYLKDAKSGAFLKGSAQIFNMAQQEKLTDAEAAGGLTLTVPQNATYRVVLAVQARKIKVKSLFQAERIKKGAVATLNIKFNKQNELTDQAQEKLDDDVVEFLKNYPNITVKVGCHTDNLLPEADNNRISTIKAEAVVAYLEEQGIDAGRLQAMGYGATRPKATNDTKKGRKKNNRIEIVITSVGGEKKASKKKLSASANVDGKQSAVPKE